MALLSLSATDATFFSKLVRRLGARQLSTRQCPERTPMLKPAFWFGKQPLDEQLYKIDCRGRHGDMSAGPNKNPAMVDSMHELFAKSGLVLLTNTGLGSDLTSMKRWADVILGTGMEYKGGANSRASIGTNVYETGAPSSGHLHYHHEMVYVSKSVQALAFCAKEAVRNTGEMYVSEQIGATRELLATPFGQKLKALGVCYVRCMTDRDAAFFKSKSIGWNGRDATGVYNHWQTSFGVETRAEAEALAAKRSLQVEWGDDGYLKTRYYADAFEHCPALDRNLLYSSVADDAVWFDTWPGVCDLPTQPSYEAMTMHGRPLRMTFGDDSDFSRDELAQFIDVYDKHGMPLQWHQGDVAVLCNYRWAHGRPEYTLDEGEKRELGVLLGAEFDRVGQRNHKW